MGYTGEQKKEYQRQWIAKRRAAWFADKCCVVCGTTENLELDHIDPSQKVDHKVWSWSKARQEQELAKCQVLCVTHHREKSLALHPISHGIKRWCKGCRCDVCRAAKSASNARHRALHPREKVEAPVGLEPTCQ